jgi:pimeloyl-ACP methyl ester carboxylesterase
MDEPQVQGLLYSAPKLDVGKLAYFDRPRLEKFFASSGHVRPLSLIIFDLYEAMKGIACPVLIIHGDHGPIPTAAMGAWPWR